MNRRYNRIEKGESDIRYTVDIKKGLFSKWEPVLFKDEDTGEEHIRDLTLEQLGCVCNWCCPENKEIDRDIKKYLDGCEKESHRKPYHITKYRDEDSRVIDTLCMAESLEELYNQLGELISNNNSCHD